MLWERVVSPVCLGGVRSLLPDEVLSVSLDGFSGTGSSGSCFWFLIFLGSLGPREGSSSVGRYDGRSSERCAPGCGLLAYSPLPPVPFYFSSPIHLPLLRTRPILLASHPPRTHSQVYLFFISPIFYLLILSACVLSVFPFSSRSHLSTRFPFLFFFRKIIPKIKWGIYRSRCQVLINFFKNPIVIRIRKHKKNHSIRYQVTR